MSDEGGPCEATPHADLIAQIMDSRVPKNEREWAAEREIARLRRELAEARELLRDVRSSIPGNHKFALRRIDAFLTPSPPTTAPAPGSPPPGRARTE